MIAYAEKGDVDAAIQDSNRAIALEPDDADAYYDRGMVWLSLRDWGKAKTDLRTAKNLGGDIAASSDNDSESVKDFKQKTGIQLPKDIVALLAQQECQKPNPSCEW